MHTALDDLRRRNRELPTAWLQSLLRSRPYLALMILERRSEPPPDELLPALAALVRSTNAAASVMVRTEAGRQLLLRSSEDLPVEQRLAMLLFAGGDPRPCLGHLEEQLRQALVSNTAHSAPTLEMLAKLPWADRGGDLTAVQRLVEQLFEQQWKDAQQRAAWMTLLQAMGPAARFAADELVTLLQITERGTGDRLWIERAAATLLAIGIHEPAEAWLRSLPPDRAHRVWLGEGTDRLDEPLASILTERVLAATDAELADACKRWQPDARRVPPERRGALAARLLAHAEATGKQALSLREGWLAGDLGATARTQLAAFFARRKARGVLPDPLAEDVASHLLTSHTDLAVKAMRDGLARVVQTLGGGCAEAIYASYAHGLAPAGKPRVAAAAAELIELALACPERVLMPGAPRPGEPDPDLGLGSLLAWAGAAPLDKILPLLDDVSTRHFALALLSTLGAQAAAADEAVERLAAGDDERVRLHAAQTLACLGPRGVLRLAGLVKTRPQLRCFLDQALGSGDDASAAAAARALLELHFVPDAALAERLRLQRRADKTANALVMLLLLTAGPPADEECLLVMDVEPAVLRQRAVQALGKTASGPLQLGAIVELLDDPDAGVRAAALDALLATPERTATCRRALEDYASTADPAVAARVREALSTRR